MFSTVCHYRLLCKMVLSSAKWLRLLQGFQASCLELCACVLKILGHMCLMEEGFSKAQLCLLFHAVTAKVRNEALCMQMAPGRQASDTA